jgi:4-amino-4-deoxy-L-arabinose transferase-like glycosyltransferase
MRKYLIVAALLLALVWVLIIPNEPVHDQLVYNTYANNILSGKGIIDGEGQTTATWTPGYPVYLAAFYYVLGFSHSTAYIANILSYLLLIAGVYTFTSLVYNRHSALLAAALTAVYPSIIMYNTIFATETLFTALMIWSMVFGWLSFEPTRNKWGWMILCGIATALAAYSRPQALIFPLALFAVGYVKRIPFFATLGRIVFISLVMLLVVSPWSTRNYLKLNTLAIASNAGLNLWIGNNDDATGGYIPFPEGIDEDKNLEQINRELGQQAWIWIQDNPGKFLLLAFEKLYITMRNESISAVWNHDGLEERFGTSSLIYFKILTNLGYFCLLLALVYYLFLYGHNRKFDWKDSYLISMALLLIAPVLVYHGDDRFHLPMIPLFIIFVSKSYDYFKNRKEQPIENRT